MHNASLDLSSAQQTIQPFRENIKSFQEIILKEVWPIATLGGKRVEYRAIGAQGRLVAFDLAVVSSLPAPNAEIVRTTEQALHSLSNHGATGAVFVDVALAEGGSAMVVECKDFTNGTIANVKAVSAGWSEWSRDFRP